MNKIILLPLIVIILIAVIAGAGYASLSMTAKTTTSSSSASSGTLIVSCVNCTGGNPNTYQFSGALDNGGESTTYDGNGTQSYTVSSNGASLWIVSWSFQKSTTAGTLTLTFVLGGVTVYSANTTASYGVVSGSYPS